MAVLPIGGFMPIPLAMMIPFMGTQSIVMGKQFGEGFQFGKRRISAMSNEEFNKLTTQQLLLENTAEVKRMIPDIEHAIMDMRNLQEFIVKEFIETGRQLITNWRTIVDPSSKTPEEIVATITPETAAKINASPTRSPTPPGADVLASAFLDAINAIKQLIPSIPTASAEHPSTTPAPPPAPTLPKIKPAIFETLKIATSATALHGPTPIQSGVSTANRLIIKDGKVIGNLDTRKPPPPKKLRAPKSILIQMRKYQAEIKAIDSIIRRLITSGGATGNKVIVAKHRGQKVIVLKKMKILTNKYDLSDAANIGR